jgi:hypothetical protein
MLTDARDYGFAELGSLAIELLGKSPFDQGFSIGMALLVIQIWLILWPFLKGGIMGVISRTPKSWAEGVAERLSLERFRELAKKRLTEAQLQDMLKEKQQEASHIADDGN